VELQIHNQSQYRSRIWKLNNHKWSLPRVVVVAAVVKIQSAVNACVIPVCAVKVTVN
jgi:hypothetical protein